MKIELMTKIVKANCSSAAQSIVNCNKYVAVGSRALVDFRFLEEKDKDYDNREFMVMYINRIDIDRIFQIEKKNIEVNKNENN